MSLVIISEIGINHNGNFKYIEEMIRQSAFAHADIAKFQLYTSKLVFGDDSRKKYEFTFEQVKIIKSLCDSYGIQFLASVFDEEKLDWCEKLNVVSYKIASRTLLTNPTLCEKVIKTGKPVLASLGMWPDTSDPPYHDPNISYLRCISQYPTSIRDIKQFKFGESSIFGGWRFRVVGLSDHSYGVSSCLYAIANGAKVIEKHFTLDKSMEGNDHIGSMNQDELIILTTYGREIERICDIAIKGI